ncbi:MAG: S41 family peptidase [Elusimicrobiota bacterium]
MKRKFTIFVSGAVIALTLIYSTFSPVRAAVDKTYDQLKMLVDIMTFIEENYVEEKQPKDLLNGAIKGMVKTLDPFSQFMEPEVYKEMKTETEGQFGGLGIRISIKSEWLTVVTPLLGTPAYRIGILPDDKIIKIEGQSTQGITVEEAVKKLRGTPGTKVTITIARESAKEPIDFTITREIIKIETISGRMLENRIGYIKLTEFNANTTRDLRKELAILEKKDMKSLILDLRNNPGGLLDEAADVCREFIGENKVVVYIQGRKADSRRDYYAKVKAPYGDLPLIVLVNRGSASGSEIVAGAVQDLKRGLLVGTTTFGKGSVQSVYPLTEGYGLRLTTAKYYTPSGRCIHRDEKTGAGGITPDIIIPVTPEVEVKLYTQGEEVYAQGKEPESAVKKQDRVEDVALLRSIELLKAREVFSGIK